MENGDIMKNIAGTKLLFDRVKGITVNSNLVFPPHQ